MLETPVVCTGAAKAGLHLVRDTDSTPLAGALIGLGEIVFGRAGYSADSLYHFGDKTSNFARCGVLNALFYAFGRVWVAAVGGGVFQVVDAAGLGQWLFPGVLCGQGHGGRAAPVVAIAQGQHVIMAGVGPCHRYR